MAWDSQWVEGLHSYSNVSKEILQIEQYVHFAKYLMTDDHVSEQMSILNCSFSVRWVFVSIGPR